MNDHGMLVMEQKCEVRSGSTLDVITINNERLPAFLQELGKLVHEQTIQLPKPKKARPRKRAIASLPPSSAVLKRRARTRAAALKHLAGSEPAPIVLETDPAAPLTKL